jgi:predicted ATPase/class 3 adenylate cyclase/uncharacterized protein HemY
MRNIPSGNITFLFTDIEGSTKLSQEFPATLQIAMERHHEIVQKAIESNNGFVFEIVGDAFDASFENAGDAVRAAVEAQIELTNEKWNDAVIKVRMGIHSGNAEWKGTTYMGYITLARTHRVMSAAHGQQILISNDTYKCVKEIFSASNQNISFRNLGERKLKDVAHPIQLFQIVSKGLREDFPPVNTLDARPNNLPVQLTSFIGRKNEIKNIKSLLRQTHLLTLTGSGGAGKTRLALQVAKDLIDDFANGVWFVELAALSEPALLPQAILKVFGLKEELRRSLEDTLCDYLRSKEILIILDNCEHLVKTCAELSENLLSNCPKLKIIATSREALRCEGEQTYGVLSLEVPDPEEKNPPEKLSQYESVKLFIDRAMSVDENFRVTKENARSLAQICFQLDGIPLAIELAAARIKILSVEKIYDRLNDRFNLLTGGKRTGLPRQQTLRSLIDWSYDLLSEQEKIVWRRLSVFAGGWTLEAAEEVCAHDKIKKEEVMELLNQLNEKSIIIFERENERYRMLETLKQYGEEKLNKAGEAKDIFFGHLKYYMEFSEKAEPKLNGSEVQLWLERLESEHGNLQSAIEWSVRSNHIEQGARLAGALGNFWSIRGHYSTGCRLLENILNNKKEVGKCTLGKLLNSSGLLRRNQGDYSKAQKLFEEGLTVSRQNKYKQSIANSLNGLGKLSDEKGNYEEAHKFYQESLELGLEMNDKYSVAVSLNGLGIVALSEGNYLQAQNFYTESLAIRREIKDIRGIANTLHNMGMIADELGNYEQAQEFYEESLKLRYELNDKHGITGSLNGLGKLAQGHGNFELAQKFFEESLTLKREIGDKAGIVASLNNLGIIATDRGNYEQSQKFYEESLALSREIIDKHGIAASLNNLGYLAFNQNNFDQAQQFHEESLAIERKMGKKAGIANSLHSLGIVTFRKGNFEQSKKFHEESLTLFRELGDKNAIAFSLTGMAEVLSESNGTLGAILLGAVETAIKSAGLALARDEQMLLEEVHERLHEKLSDEDFLKYFEEGKKKKLDEAVAMALF